MALQAALSPFLVTPTRLSSLHSHKNRSRLSIFKSPRCVASSLPFHDPTVTRRSANYQPSVWDYEFVQSFSSDFTDEKHMKQLEVMKNDVKGLINGVMDPLAKLELIDAVQRLGLKYHFEMEIKKALETVNWETEDEWLNDDLYTTALRFRLLRQHGYNIPQDVFKTLKDKNDNFKASLGEDVKGLLSLYEASFFGLEGEITMDEAKAFTTTRLKDLMKASIPSSLARKVDHALDMPLHWRVNRVEAIWFIDTYEQEQDMNHTLLELAKLDYNIVQFIHKKEVSKLASWWVYMGLDKMTFARGRLVEHWFWMSGMVFEPQFGDFREMGTKIVSMVTLIDDVYDVYGSLEELELFTYFVDRWDITGIDKLPHPIKTCLLAMYNTSNEIGYWTIKERGFNIIPYLSKMWARLCKAYLKEAKWYHKGYKPTLEEYLNNAVVSISGQLLLFCSYILTADQITKEALDYVDKLPSIMRSSCMIGRLINDLGTSSDELVRGDNLKSIQCYMNETGASEEVSREHIIYLIHETWKTLNKEMFGHHPISEPFISANPNFSRISQCFYQYGDGHGIPDYKTKDHLMALLVQPVPIK